MNIFKNMKIRDKLSYLFAGIFLSLIISLGISIFSLNAGKNIVGDIANNIFQGYKKYSDSYSQIMETHIHLFEIMNWISAGHNKDKIQSGIKDQLDKIDVISNNISQMKIENKNKDAGLLLSEMEKEIAEYKDWTLKVFSMIDIDSSDLSMAYVFMDNVNDRYLSLKSNLDKLKEIEDKLVKKGYEQAIFNSWATIIAILILSIFFMSVIVLVLIQINRSIIHPLNHFGGLLKSLESGDLVTKSTINTKDEMGEMAKAFNSFSGLLNKQIITLKESALKNKMHAGELSEMATVIASGSQEQAAGSEEIQVTMEQFSQNLKKTKENILQQTASLDNITVSMNQLTTSIQEVLLDIQRIRAQANENVKMVESGKDRLRQSVMETSSLNDVITDLTDKIRAVGNMSESIDSILKVIEDVVERTNILAMNAAIESAHAGEAGQGFSIVSSEIRRLAYDSSNSVKEIEVLIDKIKKGVTDAVAVTDKGIKSAANVNAYAKDLGDFFENISSHINTIDKTISDIAARMEDKSQLTKSLQSDSEVIRHFTSDLKNSVQSQTEGAMQISASINVVAVNSEKNASSSDALSNFALALEKRSNELGNIVEFFKTE